MPGPNVFIIAAPYYLMCHVYTYFELGELHDHVTIALDEWSFGRLVLVVFLANWKRFSHTFAFGGADSLFIDVSRYCIYILENI